MGRRPERENGLHSNLLPAAGGRTPLHRLRGRRESAGQLSPTWLPGQPGNALKPHGRRDSRVRQRRHPPRQARRRSARMNRRRYRQNACSGTSGSLSAVAGCCRGQGGLRQVVPHARTAKWQRGLAAVEPSTAERRGGECGGQASETPGSPIGFAAPTTASATPTAKGQLDGTRCLARECLLGASESPGTGGG